MFLNFRRIRKCQCVQLLTTCLALCTVMVCWEELDHHVVSHVRSYGYRYLVNSYGFINTSFARREGAERGDGGGYPYLIDHRDKCGAGGDNDILLLLFVKSAPDNAQRRRAIRATWGNESYACVELGASVRVMFALGVHPDPQRRALAQASLLAEDVASGDLVQQDFADTFHNLTAKLLLQFQWAHGRCPGARFVMTTDDDVFVHVPNLVRYLQGLPSAVRDLWVGHVHRGSPPNRRPTSKYHVPYELYPWSSYPDYTSGAGYVVSRDVVARIHRATLALSPAMYIDDVFMGICASFAGVSPPRDHPYFSGEGTAPRHPCVYTRMITSHGHARGDIRALWREATDPAVVGLASGLTGDLYCSAVRAMLLCRPYFYNTYSCLAAF